MCSRRALRSAEVTALFVARNTLMVRYHGMPFLATNSRWTRAVWGWGSPRAVLRLALALCLVLSHSAVAHASGNRVVVLWSPDTAISLVHRVSDELSANGEIVSEGVVPDASQTTDQLALIAAQQHAEAVLIIVPRKHGAKLVAVVVEPNAPTRQVRRSEIDASGTDDQIAVQAVELVNAALRAAELEQRVTRKGESPSPTPISAPRQDVVAPKHPASWFLGIGGGIASLGGKTPVVGMLRIDGQHHFYKWLAIGVVADATPLGVSTHETRLSFGTGRALLQLIPFPNAFVRPSWRLGCGVMTVRGEHDDGHSDWSLGAVGTTGVGVSIPIGAGLSLEGSGELTSFTKAMRIKLPSDHTTSIGMPSFWLGAGIGYGLL